MSTVTVQFAHPHGAYEVGDTADLETGDAKRLVRAGVATYATKAQARKAGEPAGEATAATVEKPAKSKGA